MSQSVSLIPGNPAAITPRLANGRKDNTHTHIYLYLNSFFKYTSADKLSRDFIIFLSLSLALSFTHLPRNTGSPLVLFVSKTRWYRHTNPLASRLREKFRRRCTPDTGVILTCTTILHSEPVPLVSIGKNAGPGVRRG